MTEIDPKVIRARVDAPTSKSWNQTINELRKDILDLLAALDARDKRIEELETENTRIRAALAQSDQSCVYCSLPRDEWNKCKSGFPGCGRSDDAMGCPELGARLEVEELTRERDELRKALTMLHYAVCGETGFANAVRQDSGRAYPWHSLDMADAMARAALEIADDS